MADGDSDHDEGMTPAGAVPSAASGAAYDAAPTTDGAGPPAALRAALRDRLRARWRLARERWDERRDLGIVDTVRSRLPQGEDLPLAVLTVVVAAWAVVIYRLIRLRHAHYGTFDFDEGIYDQYFWNLAHGSQANTVRGVPFFGHHASYAMFLLLPLVWLGGDVNTWNGLHVIALGATAFVLYALARDKLGSAWWGLAAGLLWLAQPTVSWLVHEGYHPDGMALPFLVGTYLLGERWAAERKDGAVRPITRWLFVGAFVLTISWKEDLALALFGIGLVWVVRRRWYLARWVLAASALWFVVFGMVVVPHVAGGTVYGGIYDLGSTPSEIIRTSAEHPSRLLEKLDENDAPKYGTDLTKSWGFVPVLSPLTLIIGAPMMGTNIISASGFTWDLHFHYQAIPVATMAISTIEGLAFLKRRRRALAEVAVIVALVSAFVCARWYGPLPGSNLYRAGYWPLTEDQGDRYIAGGLALIPSKAGVSAFYLAVPHLTHRTTIYTFPNPWRPSNYGVRPGVTGDPAKVDWLAMDLAVLNPDDRALFDSIQASGEFAIRYARGTVVVLERVAAPGKGSAPIDPEAKAPVEAAPS